MILFLDVDGVLNHQGTYRKHKRKYQNLDAENLSVLKEIMDRYHSRIVLTSSWRYFSYNLDILARAFQEYGIDPWISMTPILDGNRNLEIKTWMKAHEIRKEEIIILDDRTDLGDLTDRLVSTDFLTGGLKREHIESIQRLWQESI